MKPMRRVFGGRVSLLLLVLIYLLMLSIRILIDIHSFDLEMFTTVRNLLFGIGVFVISSVWMNTQRRIDTASNILLWGTFFVALYGIRQLLFGFLPFELDRLSMMGHSLKEMETLGRIRLTSSFGDPVAFAFFLMVGIFVYFIARSRNISFFITRKTYPFSVIIFFVLLILTQTRAPLIGLLCGAAMLLIIKFKLTPKYIISLVGILLCVVIFLGILNSLVNTQVLANTSNSFLININNGLESFWSLYQFADADSVDIKVNFLVSQSKNARYDFLRESLLFLSSNPFGGGLANKSHYMFSLQDVGLLSLGLQIGIIGLIAFFSLLLLIGILAWVNIRRISQLSVRTHGYLFICLWFSIIITSGITSIFDSSAIGIVIWTLAGILVNQKRIYFSRGENRTPLGSPKCPSLLLNCPRAVIDD
jgi:hypothetical protein